MTDRMTKQEIEALCSWIDAGATSGLIGVDAALSAEKLQQALTAIRQLQQPWRGIESAPKDGTQILVPITSGGIMNVVSWWGDAWREGVNGLKMKNDPTVWMPLPTPPETGR